MATNSRQIFRKITREDNCDQFYSVSNITDNDNTNTNNYDESIILKKSDIIDSLPNGASTYKMENIELGTIEWRWRFFNIDGRKMIEISYEDGKKRIYTDRKGNRIEKNNEIDTFWDKYLVKILYAYVKE